MKLIEKGQCGYLEQRKKIHLIITSVGFLIVFIMLMTGIFVTETRNNIFTVMAIITVLPVAKFAVTYAMIANHKAPSKERYEELTKHGSNLLLISECVISCKDKSIYIPFALITDTCIYCYTENEKFDTAYFEENISEFIKSCGDTINVKLIKDYNTFKQRVQSLNDVEYKQNKAERVKKDFLILVI